MGLFKDAVESLKISLKTLNNSEVCNTTKTNSGKILIQSIKKLQNKPDNKFTDEDNSPSISEFQLGEENVDVPGVSSKVRIEENEVQGRFAVAVEDIPPGTIVAAGQPTVAILNPDNKNLIFQYCLQCLGDAPLPHPCLTCSNVVYCSETCRVEAATSFHRFAQFLCSMLLICECLYFFRYQCQLNLYHYRQIDTEDAFNVFMVLQTLWQKPFSFWKKNFTQPGAELVGEVDLEYKRYWNMMRHIQERSDKQFLKIIIISVFLLRVSR